MPVLSYSLVLHGSEVLLQRAVFLRDFLAFVVVVSLSGPTSDKRTTLRGRAIASSVASYYLKSLVWWMSFIKPTSVALSDSFLARLSAS